MVFFLGCSPSTVQQQKEEEQELAEKDPFKAMDLFLTGVNAETDGDVQKAIEYYTQALQYDQQPGIYYALAKSNYSLNRLSPALNNIKKCVSLDSTTMDYLNLMQEIFVASKLKDSAVVVLERMLSLDSTRVMTYYDLAALYEADKPLKALDLYNTVLQYAGEQWIVLVRIAELHERLGNFEQAASAVKRLEELDPRNLELKKTVVEFYVRAKKYDEAIQYSENIKKLYPDDLENIQRLASIYIGVEKWDDAVENYEILLKDKSVRLDAKIEIAATFFYGSFEDSLRLGNAKTLFNVIAKDTTDWQVSLFLGAISAREGNNDTAKVQFNYAIENAPYNPEAWVRLAGLYFDNREYAQAIILLEQAVEKFPKDYYVNFILGLSEAQEGNNEKAVIHLQAAYDANPSDPQSASALGFTYSTLKQDSAAIVYLQKAILLNPTDAQTIGVLASIYNGAENYEKSDSLFNLALAISPEDPLLNNNYGYSLSERGVRLEDALAMVEKSLTAETENLSYLDTKGWVLYQLGRYEEAYTFIKKAIEVAGDREEVTEHLGDVLVKLGRTAEAKVAYKTALTFEPENSRIKSKIEQLESK